MLSRIANLLLKPFNRKLVHSHFAQLFYQHDYGSEGYSKYRDLQIFHNKRKITSVWADKDTLSFIAAYIVDRIGQPKAGLCHGTRNGFEQQELARLLKCDVYGTEISDSATQFPKTFKWDFHEPKPEWIRKFSFVYSNALDHAFDPQRALSTWANQIDPNEGMIFIEHTMAHSPEGASEMDPFGAHPFVMPYLIFEWGREDYRLLDILHPPRKKANDKLDVWVFVIEKVQS